LSGFVVLRLKKEEVIRYDKTVCGERVSVRSYGSVGSVEIATCCCFVCVDSNIGTLIPSYGCDRDAVNFIVSELNELLSNRGGSALTTALDEVVVQTDEIHTKTGLIARHMKIEIPESTSSLIMDDR
jgi:hypothetical protein